MNGGCDGLHTDGGVGRTGSYDLQRRRSGENGPHVVYKVEFVQSLSTGVWTTRLLNVRVILKSPTPLDMSLSVICRVRLPDPPARTAVVPVSLPLTKADPFKWPSSTSIL